LNPEDTREWTELRRMIDKQRQSFMMLHELLKTKEKAIIKGDTEKLSKIIKDEEEIIKSADELEKKRLELVLACMGREKNPPTLSELLEVAPEFEKANIEKSALDLMRSLTDVAAANRGNAELVKESMNFVTYFLNLITSDWGLTAFTKALGN
jgi:hypothetical protein